MTPHKKIRELMREMIEEELVAIVEKIAVRETLIKKVIITERKKRK